MDISNIIYQYPMYKLSTEVILEVITSSFFKLYLLVYFFRTTSLKKISQNLISENLNSLYNPGVERVSQKIKAGVLKLP